MATKIYFINSSEAQYTDDEFAWFQTLMFNEGIIGDPDSGDLGLLVTQNAVPDMSVLVEAGKALIEIVISGRTLKVVAENTASEQLAIAANSSGSNRVDAVIFRVDKDTEPNETKSNVATLEVITGSGTSPLSNAAISTAVGNDGWVRLADIEVPNAASSIIDSYITDVRSIVTFSNGFSFGSIFTTTSAGAADSGKVPQLNADGKLDESFTTMPITRVYNTTSNNIEYGASDTQMNITDEGGGTFRYTWNGNGTNPNISAANFPTGEVVSIINSGLNAANEGAFIITASSTNYFEVTNTSGIEETSIALGGSKQFTVANTGEIWTKPAGLKYIELEVAGAGGSGGDTDSNGSNNYNTSSGGGAGGYARKRVAAADLPTSLAMLIGKGADNASGAATVVGQMIVCNGGTKGENGAQNAGVGGIATGGDVNIQGGDGFAGLEGTDSDARYSVSGGGGSNPIGFGGGSKAFSAGNGLNGKGFGGGGGGGSNYESSADGGDGANGGVILTEYYN